MLGIYVIQSAERRADVQLELLRHVRLAARMAGEEETWRRQTYLREILVLPGP